MNTNSALRALFLFAVVACLQACGGGGSDSTDDAPRVASAPTRSKAPACVPRVASVALIGDSTMWYQGDRIQRLMDAQFGAGHVVVTNYGVPGSRSWDAPHVAADVIVPNYGINDENSVAPEDFAKNMLATGATLIETQNPTVGGTRAPIYVAVDESLGLPIADTYDYVLGLADWQSMLRDGIHPNDELLDLIAQNVLGPAIAGQVAPILCR